MTYTLVYIAGVLTPFAILGAWFWILDQYGYL